MKLDSRAPDGGGNAEVRTSGMRVKIGSIFVSQLSY